MDNTAEQNAANISGHKEEQDSAWSSITEKDILQADLWGNFPDVKHSKDEKPLSGEKVLDQVTLTQSVFFTKNHFQHEPHTYMG